MHLHLENTDLISLVLLTCVEEFHLISLLDASVHHLEVSDDTPE